jgi:hypothetical protein
VFEIAQQDSKGAESMGANLANSKFPPGGTRAVAELEKPTGDLHVLSRPGKLLVSR